MGNDDYAGEGGAVVNHNDEIARLQAEVKHYRAALDQQKSQLQLLANMCPDDEDDEAVYIETIDASISLIDAALQDSPLLTPKRCECGSWKYRREIDEDGRVKRIICQGCGRGVKSSDGISWGALVDLFNRWYPDYGSKPTLTIDDDGNTRVVG